jgi:hypothetical protein
VELRVDDGDDVVRPPPEHLDKNKGSVMHTREVEKEGRRGEKKMVGVCLHLGLVANMAGRELRLSRGAGEERGISRVCPWVP